MSVALAPKAVDAPNLFLDVSGRTIAYRKIGEGSPFVLGTRFRGNLDKWDPAFLDALVERGLQVITFDYSGLGLSTGQATYNPIEMAQDFRDLIAGLGLRDAAIGGWSLGGLAVQATLALYPANISQIVIIGSGPPGPMVKPSEQTFYDVADKENYSGDDNAILFFEPNSAASRKASEQSLARLAKRTQELSREVPIAFARATLEGGPKNPIFPADAILEALKSTTVPILHVGGDHDIIFPVENWYALNQKLKTLHVLTFPQAGHGPQHQHPEMCADMISSFIKNTASSSDNTGRTAQQ